MVTIWQTLQKPILCLAPMDGVADTVYRQVIDRAGRPDLKFTEFTSVEGLWSKGFDYVSERLTYTQSEQPLIAQIWGTTPGLFTKTAALLKERGFAGIDINMGCPDRSVVKAGGGAALIDQPELARDIIKATREGAGELPISVKTRLGRRAIITQPWTTWLLESGIDALTLHGRTEKELSKVPAHWDEIGKAVALCNQLKSTHSPVLIGNGDVDNRREAMDKIQQYGVDGVMIGRGALKNPWVFNKFEIKNSKFERMELLKFHMELFVETWGDKKPFVTLRKYFKIYAQGFRGAVRMRESLMRAANRDEVLSIITANTQ